LTLEADGTSDLREIAYAKINLALHVRRRREDGYHELETLFAFVDAGDVLSAAPAAQDSVTTLGDFAGGLDNPFDNLVARALNTLPRPQALAVTLEKNLPVAAGLGGGSADAGAVFRMVEALHGLPDDWQARAAKLGADVPACVLSRTHIGVGTGTEQREVEDDIAGTPVLLVNPRVPLSTGPVFAAWWGRDDGPLPEGSARDMAIYGTNGLESPAIGLCFPIADVIEILRATEPMLARMSGSGATCFALYHSPAERDHARQVIARKRPDWWTMAGKLR
jgi:4-diphosphocytidyl-2-C-methyl-D-erythritol kinase